MRTVGNFILWLIIVIGVFFIFPVLYYLILDKEDKEGYWYTMGTGLKDAWDIIVKRKSYD